MSREFAEIVTSIANTHTPDRDEKMNALVEVPNRQAIPSKMLIVRSHGVVTSVLGFMMPIGS